MRLEDPPPLLPPLLPLMLCGKIRAAALFWEGMGVVGDRWVGGGGEFEVAAAYPSADALPNQRDNVQGMSNTVSTVTAVAVPWGLGHGAAQQQPRLFLSSVLTNRKSWRVPR